MMRRWQLTQTNATMLLLELHCFFTSWAVYVAFPSENGNTEMLRSKSMLRSFGLIRLFFMVFLFRGSLSWRSMLPLWFTGLLHIDCCFLFVVEIGSDSSLEID